MPAILKTTDTFFDYIPKLPYFMVRSKEFSPMVGGRRIYHHNSAFGFKVHS